MIEGTERVERRKTWVNRCQVPEFFSAFAEKYRVEIHRDVYGDPIVPGIWGQFFVHGDNQIGVSLMNRFTALRKNLLMAHQSPTVVVVCEAETEVNLFCSPEDDRFIQEAMQLLEVHQLKEISETQREAGTRNLLAQHESKAAEKAAISATQIGENNA